MQRNRQRQIAVFEEMPNHQWLQIQQANQPARNYPLLCLNPARQYPLFFRLPHHNRLLIGIPASAKATDAAVIPHTESLPQQQEFQSPHLF